MKILALEHEVPGAATEAFERHKAEEARKVWDLYQAGVFRELYFRADRNEAILILECESVEEAQEILSTMPFVQHRLIAFEVIPLKAYPGFKRLFSNE
jgi:muconolactone delta-isomerase